MWPKTPTFDEPLHFLRFGNAETSDRSALHLRRPSSLRKGLRANHSPRPRLCLSFHRHISCISKTSRHLMGKIGRRTNIAAAELPKKVNGGTITNCAARFQHQNIDVLSALEHWLLSPGDMR